ncbi:N-acetyltransferase [Deinococcus piscis]|uniref:N-acetyltransferase n=1 Tax=Deinococcus piscis TaxID=394230 RepID=A0ABQ3K552_9DEIO|nr:GNAT family N-acetyltransferase [Deinococcus piscis]GHG03469.1 N-acetyltransferase [Deinococcus piscis]
MPPAVSTHDITFDSLQGDFSAVLGEVARLRLTLFREFPYLYEGTAEAEAEYLQTYAQAPGALLILARDRRAGGRVVGACTAVPLAHEGEELQAPFRASGLDPAQVLYLGEALLETEYQSLGLGGQMMDRAEAHADALGLPLVAAAMVQRPADHPLKPAGWRSPRRFLERRGYAMRPELDTTLTWQELGEASPSPKPMRFWVLERGRGSAV